jgi:large subunit ribosomal protein L32
MYLGKCNPKQEGYATAAPLLLFIVFYSILVSIMVVHMRHTSGHTGNRRSHHALKTQNLVKCGKCDAFRQPHTVCRGCGDYNGRTVINTLKKVEKKTAAQKTAAK